MKHTVYLHKDAASAVNALRRALPIAQIPREIYLVTRKRVVSEIFKAKAQKYGIKPILGRPYNPRGRGKIERYHKTPYQEHIAFKEFRLLSHFKRVLWPFEHPYSNWR